MLNEVEKYPNETNEIFDQVKYNTDEDDGVKLRGIIDQQSD